MKVDSTTRPRRKLVPEMEGATARWYARVRGTDSRMAECRAQAAQLTEGLPAGAAVLEVAPGPGYLAVEIARLGRYRVIGLDISRTFVQLASEYSKRAGVAVEFRQGDVSSMPFEAESFDLIVCQAAFKNFVRPDAAVAEMYRVLRPGGTAVIQDMRRDASAADIDREVRAMGLGRLNVVMTKSALWMLRRRAYTRAQFERLAAGSPFRRADVRADGIGVEVRLTRPPAD